MDGSLVETKFFAPRLRRGHVARPEVLRRLARASDARLTLVSAPAGFGKTTLIVEWLTAPAVPPQAVAWLSLDERDGAPAAFLAYVIAALQKVLPDVGAAALQVLASSPQQTDQVLTLLLNDLTTTEEEVWLVLDDYHLADGPDVGAACAFLIDHLPAHCIW